MKAPADSVLATDFSVFEATPGLSVLLHTDGPAYTIVALSNDLVAAIQKPRNQFTGKSYVEFFDDSVSRNLIRSSFEKVIQNKIPDELADQPFPLSAVTGFNNGEYHVRNVPVENSAGDVTYIISSIITPHREATGDNDIKRAYKFFMDAPVIIGYVRGDDYIIDFANDGLLEIWGRTNEVVGKPLLEAIPELQTQGTKQLLDQVRMTGKPFFAYKYPLTLVRKGETQVLYFDFIYQPFYENGNETIASGVISVGHDVTEQVRAGQLERSIEALKYENANLEEFAYAASHDLKEPVRKIHVFLNTLREQLKEKLDKNQLGLFDRLQKASSRMHHLIDDLLEFSQAAKGTVDKEDVILDNTIQSVLDDLELEIQNSNAIIVVEPLPTINSTKRQMHQVFQNLIGNALKYRKQDVVPEIRISSQFLRAEEVPKDVNYLVLHRSYYLIEIADNGIGFDQKDADRIFKVFTRLHGLTEYGGTGVGLSIVKKVVESLNGTVWAESELNKGATFKILLPVMDEK